MDQCFPLPLVGRGRGGVSAGVELDVRSHPFADNPPNSVRRSLEDDHGLAVVWQADAGDGPVVGGVGGW